ncbi:hypothetical protein F4777DRAFT_587352 [Nemania sp. FL0916]|nr:hypothetical protein F4777DRAFT_587352 [Nemania sp. FL0916]
MKYNNFGKYNQYAEASQSEPPTVDVTHDTHGVSAPTKAPTMGVSKDVRIRGATRQICLASLLITVPTIAFVALLSGLVYHYRIEGGDATSPNLESGTKGEAGVIYLNFSATTLTTVASWSSTAAPLLITFAISLSSFPAARKLLDAAQTPKGSDTLVFVTDTWLHFTTETVSFTQISSLTELPTVSFDLYNDGRQQCYNVTYPEYGVGFVHISDRITCTLSIDGPNTSLLGYHGKALLLNSSLVSEVKTYMDSNETNFTYIGVPAQTGLSNVDFSAHTWALSSSCRPITEACIDSAEVITSPHARFNCSPIAFAGYFGNSSTNWMTMQYFSDASMSQEAQLRVSVGSPYYYAAIASVNPRAPYSTSLPHDPGVTFGFSSSIVIAVACNTAVWDVEYTSTNGSITRFVASPSNTSMANIMMGTQWLTQVADAFLTQSFSTGAWLGNSSQDIADSFANEYSFAALALGGSAMMPSLATEAQLRTDLLVARVPLAPLYGLLASNLLIFLMGLILTIWAISAARGDVREVQARLGVVSLVGSYFEGDAAQRPVRDVEDMFAEKSGVGASKVGVFKTPLGGWILGAASDE